MDLTLKMDHITLQIAMVLEVLCPTVLAIRTLTWFIEMSHTLIHCEEDLKGGEGCEEIGKACMTEMKCGKETQALGTLRAFNKILPETIDIKCKIFQMIFILSMVIQCEKVLLETVQSGMVLSVMVLSEMVPFEKALCEMARYNT